MHKAIHSYNAESSSHTLSFQQDDVLCVLEKTNGSWWLAANSFGTVGYVPKSYIESYSQINSNDTVIQSVDRAIFTVKSTARNGQLTTDQKSLLKKLLTHKQGIVSSIQAQENDTGKRKAPLPPGQLEGKVSSGRTPAPPPPTRTHSQKLKSSAPAPPPPVEKNLPKSETASPPVEKHIPAIASTEPHSKTIDEPTANINSQLHIPADLGHDLMDAVAEYSQLSNAKLRQILKICFTKVGERIPTLSKTMESIIETFPDYEAPDPAVESLGLAFANLAEIKDDAQQRNWAIADDKGTITNLLGEILTILSNTERKDCIQSLSYDQYTPILTLASYYQMEPRTEIRMEILQILGLICSFSPKCISILLSSVLPDELAREIKDHTAEVERTCYVALVLSMVFSTGEPVPVSYYETIGTEFISFIIECIEEGIAQDEDDRLRDIFVRLLLAINLHFVVPADNLFLKVISERPACTRLSECIMLVFNRGDDPVPVVEQLGDQDDSQAPPHSTLKFLQDIFSLKETAQSFLYTNDLLVLIDIIVRNVADLSAGNKLRTEYLDLLLNILTNSIYHETMHRSSEIITLLHRIQDEEEQPDVELRNVAQFDKSIVAKILSKFDKIVQ